MRCEVMEYVFHILVFVGIYAILAVSLDLLAGSTGILSLSHAAFYGLGAYSSALISIRLGASFPVGVLAGMVVAGLSSLLVSVPSARLQDDYFVLATLGFQLIIVSILNNWTELTRGPLGIPGIPPLSFLGYTLHSRFEILPPTFVLAVLAYAMVNRLANSPFGRVLRAVREDEVLAQSLGKNPLRFKAIAFAVSGGLAAMAGGLYAHYMSFVDPSAFSVMESLLVISMVIIGGAGSTWGPLSGALILVILPEVLRLVGLPTSLAANLRQVLYGGLLTAMMLVRPRGLFGRYGFGR